MVRGEPGSVATPLELVKLTELMKRTAGRPEISVGLLDGPIALTHPDLRRARIHASGVPVTCRRSESLACRHGTFVAGVLCARRGAAAPAICPDCSFVVRPIFRETASTGAMRLSATSDVLADAIITCVQDGARIVNLSGGIQACATPAGL